MKKLILFLLTALITSCATNRTNYRSDYSTLDGVYLTNTKTSSYKPAKASKKNTYKPMSTQCAATTKKGLRCSRTATPGSIYCWQHRR